MIVLMTIFRGYSKELYEHAEFHFVWLGPLSSGRVLSSFFIFSADFQTRREIQLITQKSLVCPVKNNSYR